MAFSVLQAVKASTASSTTATTTGVTTQTTGSQFVVFVARDGDKSATVSDNKGNTYAVKADKYNGSSSTGVDSFTGGVTGCWVCTSASPAGGATHTFTVTLSAADFPTIIVFECTGLDVTVDAGGSASANHSGNTSPTSFTSPTITTVTAADVLMGFGGSSGDTNSPSQTLTAGVGGGTYTTPTNGSQTTVVGLPMMAGHQVVSATSTYSVTYTPGSANTNQSAGIIAFKQAAGAAARQQTLTMLGVGV
jgi:hypothetical protein